MLRKLSELVSNDPHFTDVKIDCHREFWEAGCLGDFETADGRPGGDCPSTHLFPAEASRPGD